MVCSLRSTKAGPDIMNMAPPVLVRGDRMTSRGSVESGVKEKETEDRLSSP